MVKIVITSTNLPGAPNITAVSDVDIVSSNQCSLRVWDGTLTAGTPATQTITFSTFIPATTVTSVPRVVYPAVNYALSRLTIGALSLAGRANPLTDLIADFGTLKFEEGHNYVFTVDLKNVLFAGSNIYWDGDAAKLTFEPYGYTGEKSFYQGLYFKWGSLVGISPKNGTIVPADLIYYPTNDDNCTVAALNFSPSPYGPFRDILEITPPTGTGGIQTDYVTNGYAVANGAPFNYADKLGDICRWIDEDYRLPREEETFSGYTSQISWNNGRAGGWQKGTNSIGNIFTFPAYSVHDNTVLEEDGTSVLDYDTYAHFGGGFATYQGVVFPASGYMQYADGYRYGVGTIGAYWSSSYTTDGKGYGYSFDDSRFQTQNSGPSSIRCVKN
jgi:hypothetical protein